MQMQIYTINFLNSTIVYHPLEHNYQKWTHLKRMKVFEMSSAGFFNVGESNIVTCFSCGCHIAGWQWKDDPWEQHVLCNSTCIFLQEQLGAKRINDILLKNTVPTRNSHSQEAEDDDDNIEQCKICFKNKIHEVFLPCAHVVSCTSCASKLNKCPICSQTINLSIFIYFALD